MTVKTFIEKMGIKAVLGLSFLFGKKSRTFRPVRVRYGKVDGFTDWSGTLDKREISFLTEAIFNMDDPTTRKVLESL